MPLYRFLWQVLFAQELLKVGVVTKRPNLLLPLGITKHVTGDLFLVFDFAFLCLLDQKPLGIFLFSLAEIHKVRFSIFKLLTRNEDC